MEETPELHKIYSRELVKAEMLNEINTSKTHLFVNAKFLDVLTP